MTSPSTTRRYGLSSGAAIKVPCKAATTANIALSGAQTIDGVACVAGDRVLVKDQAATTENGIYLVDAGAWTRDADFDDNLDVVNGTLITVLPGGAVNANTFWRVSATDPVVIDSSAIAFTRAIVSDSSSVSFIQAGTGAQIRTAQDKMRDVVSAFDFMTAAQITDVKTRAQTLDVSAAVQAALTAISTAGGGALYMPRGTYLIGTLLQVESYTKVYGDGPGVTIVKLKSTISTSASNAFKTTTGVGYHYDITIEDLEVDGNKANIAASGVTEGWQSGIYMDQVELLTIRNVYVHDCVENGMYIVNGPLNVVVDGCSAQSNGKAGATAGRGIVFGVTPQKFRVVNCNLSANKLQGILIQSEGGSHAEGFVIANNMVQGNGSHGIDCTDNVFSGVAYDVYIRDAVITGNAIYANTGYGVRLSENAAFIGGFTGKMKDINVSGNDIFANVGGGVLVSVANDGRIDRVLVTGNNINGNGGAAVAVSGANCFDTRIANNNTMQNGSVLSNTGTRTYADIAQSWTPSEVTIGALTTSAFHEEHGNICIASAQMTWPATTDGTDVVINGLPFATRNAEGARQAFVTLTDAGSTAAGFLIPLVNSTQSQLFRNNGVTRTKNSEMSGKTLRATWQFEMSTST